MLQAEDGIRDVAVTGVQTCALPISIIYDADQQKYLVVCPFSDYSQAFVISVSGTTITASSSTDLPQKGAGWSGDYDESQNKGVFLYNRSSDSDPYVVAATISGPHV